MTPEEKRDDFNDEDGYRVFDFSLRPKNENSVGAPEKLVVGGDERRHEKVLDFRTE